MFKNLRKIVMFGAALMGAVVAHGATTRYVELRSTLQPNTTGPAAIFVGSGTIRNLSASTATVSGPLTVTGLSTLSGATISGTATLSTIAGTITDNSTTTHNGAHTFSSMTATGANITGGTLSGVTLTGVTFAGTNTDTSTTTYSGSHTFSSATVTNLTVTASTHTRANISGLTAVLNSALNANTFQINNVSTPTAGTDAPRFHNVGIVQAQYYSVTSASNTAATGSGYINTHLTGSFTPQFSDSRIFVFLSVPVWIASDGTSYLRVARSGVTIDSQCQMVYQNGTNNGYGSSCIQVENSPGTSAVTYTVQLRTPVAGGTCDGTNACSQKMVILEVNTK